MALMPADELFLRSDSTESDYGFLCEPAEVPGWTRIHARGVLGSRDRIVRPRDPFLSLMRRYATVALGTRSPSRMANCCKAAFQSFTGLVHFLAMCSRARYNSLIGRRLGGNDPRVLITSPATCSATPPRWSCRSPCGCQPGRRKTASGVPSSGNIWLIVG